MSQTPAAVVTQPVGGGYWRRAGRWLAMAIASAALFAATLWLYSRNNDGDMNMHPDEPSKVQQILSGDYRNFNHPQLLLEGTQLALHWFVGYDPTPEQIVRTGRTVSAAYSAGAVVALAWAGYAVAGGWGWIFAAAFAGLCPSLLANAHYMKEEGSLILGVGVTTLGLAWFTTARRWYSILPAAAVLGIGVGLAISGKYVGAATIPTLLLAPLVKRWYRWPPLVISPFLLMLGLVLTVAWINHRVWEQPQAVREAIDREMISATEEHFGVVMNRPNAYFAAATWQEMLGPVRVLAGAFALMLVVYLRRSAFDWLLVLLTGSFLLVVSNCIVPFNRYALPVVVLVYFAAAITAARLTRVNATRAARTAVGLVLLALFLEQAVPRTIDFTRQFGGDSRLRLADWIKTLPTGTQIVQDSYAKLEHIPQLQGSGVRILSPQWAGAMGGLDQLRRRDIRYVVLCEFNYNRFITPYTFGEAGETDRFDHLRAFYKNLLENHTPVWQAVPDYNMNAMSNPVVKVYRIDQTPAGATGE